MFWDGHRWLKEPATDSVRARKATSSSLATWSATGLMFVLLVGIAVPIYRANADAATLAIAPAEGVAGARVSARIDRIPAGTAVVLLWDGSPLQSSQVAGKSGKLHIRFTVPQVSPGMKRLTLVTATATRDAPNPYQSTMASGALLASAAFTVLPTVAQTSATPDPSAYSPTPTPEPSAGTPASTPGPSAATSTSPSATPEPGAAQSPAPTLTAPPTPAPTPAPPPPPPPPPPPSIDCTLTFGGDASGATDVTAGLQSFLRQAPAGATACLAQNGQYRVEGTVHLPGRESGITIDGHGARMFATTRRNQAMMLIDQGGRNIVLRNLTIEGYNPNGRTSNAHEYAWEFGHGIALGGVINTTITNVQILNMNGDGILIDGGTTTSGVRWSDGVVIQNVLIDGVGRMGVAFTNGVRNSVVSGSTVRNTGMYAFVIEPDGNVFNGEVYGADGITITGNAISSYSIDSTWGPYLFAATGHGPQNNIEFSNNAVYGQNLHVAVQPNGYARTNIRILNNRSDVRVPGPVMEFAGCSNLTVTGNTQLISSGELATVSGCSNVDISNNITN